MENLVIQLCKGGTYKVLPKPMHIDLKRASALLKKAKWKLVSSTPILIIIEKKGVGKVTLYPIGKMVFSDLKDEAKVRQVSESICSLISK